jgi:hypothetical protein
MSGSVEAATNSFASMAALHIALLCNGRKKWVEGHFIWELVDD